MSGKTLAYHTDIVMGQSPPGKTCNFDGHGLPLLNGPTEFGTRHPFPAQYTADPRKRARQGDLLFCVRGSTTGRMNWADQDYAIGRGIAAIRHKTLSELQPLVRAVIEYNLPGLLAQATGSTFPNVSATQLADIWWPPLSEDQQRAAAHILGTLETRIDLHNRANETLEAMARALFKSWFVDFDPVRAKSSGQKTDANEHLAGLFPTQFSDSASGPIPDGWHCLQLREIADVFSGGTPRKSNAEYWDGSIPWISPKSMTSIHTDTSEDNVTAAAIGNGTRLVKKGAVLVMVRGMGLHQGVRISQAQCDVTFNQDVKGLVPKWGDGTFLLFALLDASPYLFSKVSAAGHGTGVLATDILEALLFAVPPAGVREALTKPLTDLNLKVAANSRQLKCLVELHATLLPEILSGRLQIDDAQKFLQEVGK